MQPSPGRIVLTRVQPHRSNGADVAPAVISRVWDGPVTVDGHTWHLVNLRVLNDGQQTVDAHTSARLFADKQAADAWADTCDTPPQTHVAYWPPRV